MAVRWSHLSTRRSNHELISSLWRRFSSHKLSDGTAPFDKARQIDDALKSRILKLASPQRSATTVLQNWIDEGRRVSISDLRGIFKLLLKRRRYKHALEVLMWMEASDRLHMTAADRAIRLELTIKIHSREEAEEYFENLPNNISRKAACFPLLHSYVKERATEKAEALMLKMNRLGLIVGPHPFNEMMKLYMATSQQVKVPSVIQQMKQNQIPRNVISYNLWMDACAVMSGVASAEKVFKEMTNDKGVVVGWSSLFTLANIYQKSGLIDKAFWALRQAENKLSTCNRLGYFFLLTLYASLNRKEEVLRLWKTSKGVEGRISCANYMCIISCLVKLGDIKEAENVFLEWESQCRTYDIRVSNILLGAYTRNGLLKRAESLLSRSVYRGARPNYKTWEILMEGWLQIHDKTKTIESLKRGFAVLEH